MDSNNIFVTINYRAKGEQSLNTESNTSRRTKIRNGEVNSTKYLIGGGVYNKNGGTIVFKAKNLEEIKQVTSERPLIKDAFMKYDVVIIPKTI